MKLICAFLLAACAFAQMPIGGITGPNGPIVPTYSLVAALHGEDSGAGTVSQSATSCSGSACSGSTVNLNAHDLIYWSTSISDSSCYSSHETITFTDNGGTNTGTLLGSFLINGFWGNPCMVHGWTDAAAHSGATLTTNLSGGALGTYVSFNALVFRCSPTCSSWTVGTNHDEKDLGNVSTGTYTSNSLGNAVANDVIVSVVAGANGHLPTLAAGTCGDGACTMPAATQNSYAAAEYKVQAGSTTGATASVALTGSGGAGLVSARFTPVP